MARKEKDCKKCGNYRIVQAMVTIEGIRGHYSYPCPRCKAWAYRRWLKAMRKELKYYKKRGQ